jgi:hypothetical protein
MHNNQILQDWIFLVDVQNQLLQMRQAHAKAEATDAIALLKSKDSALFIFCSELRVIVVNVIDDEWKGRRMSQHVCNGRAICTG